MLSSIRVALVMVALHGNRTVTETGGISETYTISHRTWRSQAIMGLEAFSWPVFIVTEGTVQATERERSHQKSGPAENSESYNSNRSGMICRE